MNQKIEVDKIVSTIKQIVSINSSAFLQNFSRTHASVGFTKQTQAPEAITERAEALALDIAQSTVNSEDNYLAWIHNYASTRWNSFAHDYNSIQLLVSK